MTAAHDPQAAPGPDWFLDDATAADAPALAAQIGDWVRQTGWMPILHTPDEDCAFVSRLIASHRVRVVRDGAGLPMGFMARRNGDVAAFCIRDDARRQGLGRALMAEAKAEEARIALWTFAANTEALQFYASEGFSEVERTDGSGNEECLPDVRLIWRRGG